MVLIRREFVLGLVIVLWGAPLLLPAAEASPKFHELAQPTSRPAGAPAYSDVCFSSRWRHPTNANDPHDTFATAEAFRVSRYLWVYTSSADFIQKAKQTADSFQCALNSMVADHPDGGRQHGRLTDLNGNLVSAPWMRQWKDPAWGCCNSPEWRASYLAAAKAALDAGADLFQMDDPGLNYTAIQWGACFCEYCMAGFRDYLATETTTEERVDWGIDTLDGFDYGAYLREQGAPVGDAFAKWKGGPLKAHFQSFLKASVTRFYQDMRAAIDAHAGRHVTFSSNNYQGRWTFPYDLFDFGLAELPHRDLGPTLIYDRLKEARDRGKAQVFTLVSEDVALTRQIIATTYACGGHLLVPWDVYLGSTPDGSRRYYGTPEQYGDVYHFVRDNASLFDGYEDAAYVIPGLPDERLGNSAGVHVAEDTDDYCAFVRAVPGNPDAPVICHVVDWRAKPEPVTLQLDRTRLPGAGAPQLELRRPGKAPEPMPFTMQDDQLVIELPPVAPWGVLVIAPGT